MIKKKRKIKEGLVKIKHFLVPPHEIASEEEGARVLAKFGIVKEDLPKIYNYDPALRGLNAKEGDMIKISRPGETAYYRVIVD